MFSSDNDSDNEENISNMTNPKVNDYIIVKLLGKKKFHYYIALVLKESIKDLTVKFLKKSSGNKFTFPDIEDVSIIDFKDVVMVLKQPLVNNRQQYEFSVVDKYLKLL